MQVYLIRHGVTPGNLESRYVGSTDEPLTEEAAEELKQNRMRYPKPELVCASPMLRCVQTAGILFPETKPQLLSGLRECAFGTFEYKNYQELFGDVQYQAWIDSGGTIPFPEGESREEFVSRSCHAFLEGCRTALDKGCSSVAFVVHGGTIMAVMERFALPEKSYFDWHVSNACGFGAVLAFDGQDIRMAGRGTSEKKTSDCGAVDNSASWDGAAANHAWEMSVLDSCISGGSSPGKRCISLVQVQELPVKTGVEDAYVRKNNRCLRCGYTTGSCAAAASKAASSMLLGGTLCTAVSLETPYGITLTLPVQSQEIQETYASCAVRKFAGDDPDATDGLLIFAKAEKIGQTEQEIVIDGGIGVGRVTKPGLEQPVGAAAINRVPREMIRKEVQEACETYEYDGGIKITISVPEGEQTAKRTFNPHLGIEGGISILGTKGIVMPMSEEALLASIRVEMKQKYENGARYLLITPGNYGADFIRKKERTAVLDAAQSMKCSNYVGETVDMAVELGFRGILFVAHIGKFIKVSGGIMNTHSASADSRAELFAAQTVRALERMDQENGKCGTMQTAQERWKLISGILRTNTTEEAVGILKQEGCLVPVMEEVAERVRFHLQKRCHGQIDTEVILFSNQYGYLAETSGADEMIPYFDCGSRKQKNEEAAKEDGI